MSETTAAPPGTGVALAPILKARCSECGTGELRVVEPFTSLVSRMLLAFLPDEDRERAEGIVEIHCRECGYVGSAQR